jgi:hypothetical protein
MLHSSRANSINIPQKRTSTLESAAIQRFTHCLLARIHDFQSFYSLCVVTACNVVLPNDSMIKFYAAYLQGKARIAGYAGIARPSYSGNYR